MHTAQRARVGLWAVVIVSLACASWVLSASFQATGEGAFGVSLRALLLAAIWIAGGSLLLVFARGRKRAQGVVLDTDKASPWTGSRARWTMALLVGGGFALASLAGGLVLAWWPATAWLVEQPVAAAKSQNTVLLIAVALVTGASEELFFRLALPRLLHGWWRWLVPTALYTLVTLASGTPALALVAMLLGLTAMWVLERTSWWFAPFVVHAMWTIAMVGIYPAIL